MDYKIVEKEPFQVIGKALEVTVKDGQNKKDILAFWNVLGVCMDFNDQPDTFNF
ncbi:hypothetical protein CHCC15291_0912 [Bacillus licheniformis]|nr:hypothetical protein CHCC15291_0912 [Bacillus licheniformis]TWM05374.1 hypothetical protein CHCC15289_0947 [Bacillus licheniformis]